MQLGYCYAGESRVTRDESGHDVQLATSGGTDAHPFFFSGFLTCPKIAASALLAVSRVAATRFYTPAAARDALIRAADPIVTSDREQLRFEAFSPCTGVYARADLRDGAISRDDFVAAGTTNVDFNTAIRAALARLRDDDAAHLTVGADDVTLSTLTSTVTEKKVPLPDSWLRGLAEVQLAQIDLERRHTLGRVETRRFLSVLARTNRRGTWWAVSAGDGLGISESPTAGAVRIAGLERLRLLADLVQSATGLTVFAGPSDGATAWQLALPDSVLLLALSPEPGRGFSGEGAVLEFVADATAQRAATEIVEDARELRTFGVDDLVVRTGLPADIVRRALAVLSSSGAAGYDADAERYFYRQLPFKPEALALLHPRLRGAEALGPDATIVLEDKNGCVTAAVRGVNSTYIVQLGDRESCTCPWHEKHASGRGRCKHLLALQRHLQSTAPGP